jgi:hypothetical protein
LPVRARETKKKVSTFFFLRSRKENEQTRKGEKHTPCSKGGLSKKAGNVKKKLKAWQKVVFHLRASPFLFFIHRKGSHVWEEKGRKEPFLPFEVAATN